MGEHLVELRYDAPREHADILDAVVQATPGASRTSLLREILADWAHRKVHEATIVLRIAGGNGSVMESDRNRTGRSPP